MNLPSKSSNIAPFPFLMAKGKYEAQDALEITLLSLFIRLIQLLFSLTFITPKTEMRSCYNTNKNQPVVGLVLVC